MSKYKQIISLRTYPEYQALESLIKEMIMQLCDQLIEKEDELTRGKIKGLRELLDVLNKADIYEKSMAEENSQSESSD